jgi:hypothetical protein
MTRPLARPLTTENRLLRATGSDQITLPLGVAISETFSAPTLGGLALTQIQRMRASEGGAASGGISDRERLEPREEPAPFVQGVGTANRRKRPDLGDALDIADLTSDMETPDDFARDRVAGAVEQASKRAGVPLSSDVQRAIDEGRLQAPEALNQQYGELGLKFDRPMSPAEAQILADNKKAEIIRDALIARTPAGFLAGAARLGAGLAAMATDPLEVATLFIPIVGAAGKAAAVARFGRVGGRVAVGAVEGGVGSLITEPLYYGLSRSQQLDYTMNDALMNVGLGAILGGGIGAVAGAFARRAPDAPAPREDVTQAVEVPRVDYEAIARTRRLAEEQRPVADIALRQFTNGQAVDVEAVMPRLSVQDAIDDLSRELQNAKKYPLATVLRKDMQIHPNGKFAAELRHRGITPQTLPGLFSRYGFKDFDNVPVDRFENMFPGFSQRVGEEGYYLSSQGLVDAVADELSGRNVTGIRDQAMILDEMSDSERQVEELTEIFNNAKAAGVILRDEAELRFVARLVEQGEGFEYAIFEVAQRQDDIAADLAEAARFDPYEDAQAAELLDRPFADYMESDIEDMRNMVSQIEADLSPEGRADLDAIRAVEERAATYAEVSEAAAICVARQ